MALLVLSLLSTLNGAATAALPPPTRLRVDGSDWGAPGTRFALDAQRRSPPLFTWGCQCYRPSAEEAASRAARGEENYTCGGQANMRAYLACNDVPRCAARRAFGEGSECVWGPTWQ